MDIIEYIMIFNFFIFIACYSSQEQPEHEVLLFLNNFSLAHFTPNNLKF